MNNVTFSVNVDDVLSQVPINELEKYIQGKYNKMFIPIPQESQLYDLILDLISTGKLSLELIAGKVLIHRMTQEITAVKDEFSSSQYKQS